MQAERVLQQEVMTRLRCLPVLALAIPNSVYFPARTEAERSMIARVIHRMKASGQITPGAPDLVVVWNGGAGLIELKRAAQRNLLGTRPRGRPSESQIEIAEQAAALGLNHAYCTSWEEVYERLVEWGAPVALRVSGSAA